MPILDKLKNMFQGVAAPGGPGGGGGTVDKKKGGKGLKHFPHITRDVDPSELWDIVGELGDGAFGKVYKAQNRAKPSLVAALKQVDITDEEELDEYSVEIDILKLCTHKNIVGIYEAYFYANKLWMYIEFCGGGALDSIMVDLEKPLTESQIRAVCREICEGLEHLHQHCVIHRDMKAGNVLLTMEGGVKLADFGVSALNKSYRQKRDSFIGTPYWMAPEVIQCETIKDFPYDFKADIWSLGITLMEFAQIDPPNHEMNPVRVLIKICKSDPPTLYQPRKWSAQFRDFLAKCLMKDPERRPTAGELLEHAFIKDATERQPIIELLSEAKAEVMLEEKEMDDALDDESNFDTESQVTTDTSDAESIKSSLPSISVVATPSPDTPSPDYDSPNPPPLTDPHPKPDPAPLPSGGVANSKPHPEGGAKEGTEAPAVKPDTGATEKKGEGKIEGGVYAKHSDGGVKEKADKAKFDEVGGAGGVSGGEGVKEGGGVKVGGLGDSGKPPTGSGVVMRRKAASPGGEEHSAEQHGEGSGGGRDVKKRTLTKTRQYMVNGAMIMSKVSKVVLPGAAENKKQHEYQLWKADLRELRVLHKQENREVAQLDARAAAAQEEQLRKNEAGIQLVLRGYEAQLEQLTKQHRQQTDKNSVAQQRDVSALQRKMKQDQERELKLFREGLKQELKLLQQELDLLPKDKRREAGEARRAAKDADHAERTRKLLAEQEETTERAVRRLEDQHRDRAALAERQFLQNKQQLIRNRDSSIWDLEERGLVEKGQLSESALRERFVLKRHHMMARHAKELDQVGRVNSAKEEELGQCHVLERKRQPKILKSDAKTRTLMFKESMRISVVPGVNERDELQKFEKAERKREKEETLRLELKHRRQMDELLAKNSSLIRELEQVHAEKQTMLEDNEKVRMRELEELNRAELEAWRAQLGQRTADLEAMFVSQRAEQDRFFSGGGGGGAGGGCLSTLILSTPITLAPPAVQAHPAAPAGHWDASGGASPVAQRKKDTDVGTIAPSQPTGGKITVGGSLAEGRKSPHQLGGDAVADKAPHRELSDRQVTSAEGITLTEESVKYVKGGSGLAVEGSGVTVEGSEVKLQESGSVQAPHVAVGTEGDISSADKVAAAAAAAAAASSVDAGLVTSAAMTGDTSTSFIEPPESSSHPAAMTATHAAPLEACPATLHASHTVEAGLIVDPTHTVGLGHTVEAGHAVDAGHAVKAVHTVEAGHMVDSDHAVDTGHTVDAGHAADSCHAVDPPHTVDAGHAVDACHAVDPPHTVDAGHAVDSCHAVDAPHTVDVGHAVDSCHAVDAPHTVDVGHAVYSCHAVDASHAVDKVHKVGEADPQAADHYSPSDDDIADADYDDDDMDLELTRDPNGGVPPPGLQGGHPDHREGAASSVVQGGAEGDKGRSLTPLGHAEGTAFIEGPCAALEASGHAARLAAEPVSTEGKELGDSDDTIGCCADPITIEEYLPVQSESEIEIPGSIVEEQHHALAVDDAHELSNHGDI